MIKNQKPWTWLGICLLLAAGCSPQPEQELPPPPTPACPDVPADPDPLCEDLARINRELESWAGQLADGYGPGVWTYGEPGYPLFHHAVEDASLEDIAGELNALLAAENNPLIQLEGVEGDTVRVSLSDDAALTQGMGSSGAQSYLQVVLYSLTSLPEVNCVDFNFEEGDHAQPGMYCR